MPTTKARQLALTAPLLAAVPVAYWLAFQYFGIQTSLKGFLLGALGWTLALALRGPFSLLLRNFPQERAMLMMGLLSGPAEETVRLILLLLTGMAFPWALSVGQGWAAIEVVYTIVNGVLVLSLESRTDEKAQMAREQLKSLGLSEVHPAWGILERIAATAMHIGFTLIVAANPWLVLLTLPVHSGSNLLLVSLIRRSVAWGEAAAALIGALTLATGLWLH